MDIQEKIILILNGVTLTFGSMFNSLYFGNISAGIGWGLAFMWFVFGQYWIHRWRERLDIAMEGWSESVDLLRRIAESTQSTNSDASKTE